MTASTHDRLYGYLPTFFRQADQAQGQPARALLAIVESELNALEGNMEALYNNWFVETCEAWVVPYLADLLGIGGLSGPDVQGSRPRERVADGIRYYRRKGTTGTLEEVILQTTDWAVRLVVFAKLTARVQSVKHVLLNDGRSVNIRDTLALDDLGGPFESIAHTVDVRPIATASVTQQGKFNLPNVGLFVWRLRPYHVGYRLPIPPGWSETRYTISPLGVDVPQFNLPRGATSGHAYARLPIALTRRAFAADLARAEREHPGGDGPDNSTYYGPARGLDVACAGQPIRPAQVVSADLDWDGPTYSLDWSAAPFKGKRLAIDVERGRLEFAEPPTGHLDVRFTYGFSGDFGGGPYDRRQSLASVVGSDTAIFRVGRGLAYQTIHAALEAWTIAIESHMAKHGLIQIEDNGVYHLPDTAEGARVPLPPDGSLTIQAKNGCSPFVIGNVTVVLAEPDALASVPPNPPPQLTLDGLLVDGRIALKHAVTLDVQHTTLVPRARRHNIAWTHDEPRDPAAAVGLRVTLRQCIVGMVRLPPGADGLAISNSIVVAVAPDNGEIHPAISADPRGHGLPYGPPTTLDSVTVFGPVTVVEFGDSRNVVFSDGLVQTRRTQLGSLSFSYVPPGSVTPRRFRCQPDLALGDQADSPSSRTVEIDVRPIFTSTSYGQAGFAQLATSCPTAITRGGTDGAEMGAFGSLSSQRRRESLDGVLDDYLNVGYQPGVFYAT